MAYTRVISSKAQVSRGAIQRLHVAMRHLFIRGHYKPLGASGEAMINSLLALEPEIYGSLSNPEMVELSGLLYIFQRLPEGIEECRYIKLIAKEGYENSYTPIVPSKRRRDCYRIDNKQMFIEMTRGKSDIYDVLTHLTFMYIEAEKIRKNSLDIKGRENRSWLMLKEIIQHIQKGKTFDKRVGFTYLSTLLGRTFDEISDTNKRFDKELKPNSLFKIVFWLGQLSIDEFKNDIDREISFSSTLRNILGHHFIGESWAQNIKIFLDKKGLINRNIHVISSNLHSVMNCFYAKSALRKKLKIESLLEVAEELSIGNKQLNREVKKYAELNGMFSLDDASGANIKVQIIDCAKVDPKSLPKELMIKKDVKELKEDVIIVMDYAFGEQAYELMDELLKPYESENERINLNIQSINILGKAGILTGVKGDIMIPNAHIFEGTADNYPFENKMNTEIFKDSGLNVFYGPMVTVLGTSLQNRDILRYFLKSSWKGIGLEMEGAHYQKAIQAASKIRNSISSLVDLRYAYYASDNPLETGSTLASGALGKSGVKPTYLITISMLNDILN